MRQYWTGQTDIIKPVMFSKQERGHEQKAEHSGLCNCERCNSQLVRPINWSLIGKRHWRVELECPNCWHTMVGVFDQETVDLYDAELDQGIEDLRSEAVRSEQERIDRFAAALALDAILPEDFLV